VDSEELRLLCLSSSDTFSLRVNFFHCMVEFDRCLRSLSVLGGRGYYKYATKSRFRVWVCRFGSTSRSGSDNNLGIGKGVYSITRGGSEESLYEFGNIGAQHDLDSD
jgi:hypothetical protein